MFLSPAHTYLMMGYVFFFLLFGLLPGRISHVYATEVPPSTAGATIWELQQTNILKGEAQLQQFFIQRRLRLEAEVKQMRQAAVVDHSVERANFEAKLSDIQSSAKKAAVVALDANILQINAKRTDLMITNLATMQDIIDKIMVRAAEAKKAGRDITHIENLVTDARTSIATAIAAVTAQASKTYIFQISTEQNLGQSVRITVQSFADDMKEVFGTVSVARQNVSDALMALGEVFVGLFPTVTPTPKV